MTHKEFVSIMIPRVNLQSGQSIVKSCWKIMNQPDYFLVFDIDHNIVNIRVCRSDENGKAITGDSVIPGTHWRFNTWYVLAVHQDGFYFDLTNKVELEDVRADKQEVTISGLHTLVGIDEKLKLKKEKLVGEV